MPISPNVHTAHSTRHTQPSKSQNEGPNSTPRPRHPRSIRWAERDGVALRGSVSRRRSRSGPRLNMDATAKPIAESSFATAAAKNTIGTGENGPVISLGKNVLPVSTSAFTLNAASHPRARAVHRSGCGRRNAANRLPTERHWPPHACDGRRNTLGLKATSSAPIGSELTSPTIISEKKMPIDSDDPALKKVARSTRGGTALGGGHAGHDGRGIRRGEDTPAQTVQEDQAARRPSSRSSPESAAAQRSDAAISSIPPTVNGRAPNRSASVPAHRRGPPGTRR